MIFLKSKVEIAIMRRAGMIAAEVLLKLEEHVKPGVSTADLDRIAEEYIRKCNAVPTFVGYQGYPKTLCTSINEEVVHGIPNVNRILAEGDVIGIDCGVTFQGFVGDHAKTFAVGAVSEENIKLIKATSLALEEGIKKVAVGNRVGDVSYAIQKVADGCGW